MRGFPRHINTHEEWLVYFAWQGMRNRCFNKNNRVYKRYGGRGITVCDRWSNFENFRSDIGPKPSSAYTLHRINNDGNYEPSNCRWATKTEQQRNKGKFFHK